MPFTKASQTDEKKSEAGLRSSFRDYAAATSVILQIVRFLWDLFN